MKIKFWSILFQVAVWCLQELKHHFESSAEQSVPKKHNCMCFYRNSLGSNEAMSSEIFTHRCWVKHICISDLTIIGWDNGLSPGRFHTNIWHNAIIIYIGTLIHILDQIDTHFLENGKALMENYLFGSNIDKCDRCCPMIIFVCFITTWVLQMEIS